MNNKLNPRLLMSWVYFYSVFPVLVLPVHATFMQPTWLVFVLNVAFSLSLPLVGLTVSAPRWLKKLWFLTLNTLAFLVGLGAVLTGDLPGPGALSTAVRTNPDEALSLLAAAPVPAGLLVFSWLAQAVLLLWTKDFPGWSDLTGKP